MTTLISGSPDPVETGNDVTIDYDFSNLSPSVTSVTLEIDWGNSNKKTIVIQRANPSAVVRVPCSADTCGIEDLSGHSEVGGVTVDVNPDCEDPE